MTFGLDRTARQDRHGRPARTAVSALTVVLCWLAALVAGVSPAAAQHGAFSNQSSVVVDYSVLDQLGPAPNVPQVLMPRPGSMTPPPPPGFVTSPVLRQGASQGERIVLTPPKGVSKRKAKRSAKARSKTRTAARTKKKSSARPKATAKPAQTQTAARAPEPPMSAPPPPPPAAAPPPPPPAAAAPNAARRIAPAPSVPAAPEPAPAPPAPPPMIAAPAVPTPPAAPKPPTPPTRTAALTPPSASMAPGQSLRVTFEAGSAQLSPEAAKVLKDVAKGMAGDDKLRIQLLAYAAGADSAARQARRLSLSRALAARSYLIGEGVRSTRIDVRALGNKSEGGPSDRIDIVVNRR